jgi:hypothetical protein
MRATILAKELASMASDYPDIHPQVRGIGLIFGLQIESPEVARIIARESFARGVIIELCGPRNNAIKISSSAYHRAFHLAGRAWLDPGGHRNHVKICCFCIDESALICLWIAAVLHRVTSLSTPILPCKRLAITIAGAVSLGSYEAGV